MSDSPETDLRQRLLEAVRQVWTSENKFTVKRVAKVAGLTPREVRHLYPRKSDLVAGVWLDAAERVRETLATPPDGQPWSLEEELANLIYGFFDVFDQDEEFFITSLDTVAPPLRGPSRLHRMLSGLIGDILRRHHPAHWAAMIPVEDLAAWQLLQLFRIWGRDETSGRERTWALADKAVTLAAGAYASPLPGQAWDLARALWRSGALNPGALADDLRRGCHRR